MNMYPIFRWVAISSSCIATPNCLALSAVAQSTPPGVTIPPTAPDAVEQTIPKPSESPRPLPGETPTLPLLPELQTPPTQESPEVTPPSSNSIFIKKIEVLGNTVLQDEIAALTQPYENRPATFEDLLELRSTIIVHYDGVNSCNIVNSLLL